MFTPVDIEDGPEHSGVISIELLFKPGSQSPYRSTDSTVAVNNFSLNFLGRIIDFHQSYEGVSKSFTNHPKVKVPEMLFLY